MKTQIHPAAVDQLLNLKSRAIQDRITVTKALRTILEDHPQITRVEFRHSAEAVGINGITARNLFDKLTRRPS